MPLPWTLHTKDYLRRIIRRSIHAIGFDLRRLSPSSNPALQLVKTINRFEVDLVLDVGANVGQFASELRTAGFRGELVSFEPLSRAHQDLSNAAIRDPMWQIHPRCAIGDHDGEIEINIAQNSVSSSVLPMLEAHSLAAADSAYMGTEKVPIFKLDTVAPAYFDRSNRPFLKIDTQGFEWQVLDGAHNIYPRIQGIMCELSLVPLYEGQRLWIDMIRRLEGDGFTLWSIQQGFIDPHDGRTLQVDAVFMRI